MREDGRALKVESWRSSALVSVSLLSRWVFIPALGVFSFAWAAVSDGSQPEPDRVEAYKETDQGKLSLDIYLPPDASAGGLRPAVVLFHGGAWISGDPGKMSPQAKYFADRGLVGISVEYRIAEKHKTTPFDAIRDAFDAMRYVRAHASAWGIDPARIAAGGGSAGGHLAAATATLNAEDLAGDAQAAAKARPNALLLLNPVYDNGWKGGYGTNRLGDRWREASPAHNLSADIPPTLTMVGDRDGLVPVPTVKRFHDNLDKLGVVNELIVYPGMGHGFFNLSEHEGRMMVRTLSDMDAFLVELGWIAPADKAKP